MQRISTSTALSTRPTPRTSGTPGYFSDGNAATGLPGTVVDQDWMNGIQETLVNAILASGLQLDPSDDTLLTKAIPILAASVQGRLLGEVYLTSSTVYTAPAGTRYVEIELVGGGGGSGGVPAPANTSQVNVSTGGNAGSYVRARIYNAALFTNVQVTIGAPGPGGAAGTHDGVPGGTTSFGTYTAPGGSGGKTASVTSFPNAGLSVRTSQGSPSTSADISYVGAGPTLWQVINGTVGVTSTGGASPFGPGGYASIGVDGGAQGAAGGLGAGGGGVMAPGTYTQGLAGAAGGQGLAIVRAYS